MANLFEKFLPDAKKKKKKRKTDLIKKNIIEKEDYCNRRNSLYAAYAKYDE